MTTRTKMAMAVGLIIFVGGGGGAFYLATSEEGSSVDTAAQVEVLYAASAINVGTAGSTALSDGRIGRKRIGVATRPSDAITDPVQITSRVAANVIAPGTILTTAMFPTPQTRIGTVVIPPGMRAISVELASVRGISGFAGAGDRIDVYRVSKGESTPPAVRLELQSVEVLNVNGAGLPTAQGQPGGPSLVYLLAVTPADAERLIFMAEFEKMYFDLVPKGEPPVQTPGAGPGPGFELT